MMLLTDVNALAVRARVELARLCITDNRIREIGVSTHEVITMPNVGNASGAIGSVEAWKNSPHDARNVLATHVLAARITA